MSTYTKPTISNYNDNPPSNDGSTNFVDNGVDWDLHINEIGDPLKNFEESEADATESAFSDLEGINPINVQDPTYGATGDGTTDDSTAIQAAISAAQAVPGTKIVFPPGAYSLGTTGIEITGDGIVLEGFAPRFVGSALFGVEFLYQGTGAAVAFGTSAKVAHFRNAINNIQVRATGAAITSASAIGIKLNNQHYFSSRNAAAKDFKSGIGLQRTAEGVGGFGALNTFYDFMSHQCKIAIQATGPSAGVSDGTARFYSGAIIAETSGGSPISGTIGLDLKVNAGGDRYYGMDIESFDTGVVVDNSGNGFFGTRTEFNTLSFELTSNSSRTEIYGHHWVGTSGIADQITDAGSNNYRSDTHGIYNMPLVIPFADKTEAFAVTKADGTTLVFDVTTSGTPSCSFANGADLLIYSDAFSTLTAKVDASSGEISGVMLTGTGTPTSGSAGEVIIGGDTSGSASAGSATLPGNPLGFIDAYVAGTPVRIPYYAI